MHITKEMLAEALSLDVTAEDLKEADQHASIIVLSKGTLIDGSPYFAYAAIPPSKYRFFKLAEAQGNYRLNDYGEILHFEKAEAPSQKVMDMMKEKYGVDHNFESMLKQAKDEKLN